MNTVYALAWKATQQLCGSMDLETAMTAFFQALRSSMPLRHIVLGRFDEAAGTLFAICRTSDQGTVRIFHSFPLTDEQLALARSLRFFDPHEAMDALIDNERHPLAPLYRHGAGPDGHPGYPFYAHRLAYDNKLYGGATFHFEPGSVVTPATLAVINAVAPPLSIFINAWFQYWELERLKDQIYRDNRTLRQRLSGLDEVRMIGAGGGLKTVMEQLRQVAPLDVAVLIRGETGTGKEMAAKALHDLSPRRNRPFVAVNCGAIPPSLIDSELFGHVKGAFTGATGDHKGRFERAQGGTLFLDEVAELPLDVQARLLRVLQEKCVERVGGSGPLPVDFRLVAATHRDLESMVERGRFREDLYYRLRVVSLRIPPLRERVQDIPLLLRHFLEQAANRFGVLVPQVPDTERRRLLAYPWPGNVRELRNVMEEALALCGSGPLRFRLPEPQAAPVRASEAPADAVPPSPPADLRPWNDEAREYLTRALERCGGKIRGPGGAAELTGLHYSTLRDKLRKYGVPHGRGERK